MPVLPPPGTRRVGKFTDPSERCATLPVVPPPGTSSRETKESLLARGVDLLEDLICPFIEKLDRVVERLAKEGFDIAIVGTKDNHHCRVAKKIADEHQRRCYVLERADDVDVLPHEEGRPVALVGQVTGNTEVFTDIIERIRRSKEPMISSRSSSRYYASARANNSTPGWSESRCREWRNCKALLKACGKIMRL